MSAQVVADAGANPLALVELGWGADAWIAAAASLIAETDAVAEVTGVRIAAYAHMFLFSLRGNRAEFTPP